jgi:hypothetical protein
MIEAFMPFYRWLQWEDGAEVIGGIFQEMLDRLEAEDALCREQPPRGRPARAEPGVGGGSTAYDSEVLKWILDEMLEKAGVSIRFHTFVHDVVASDVEIQRIRTVSKSGVEEVSAAVFVDTTGDADVAHLAGLPTVLGRETDGRCQAMTVMFRVGDVDMEVFEEHGLPHQAYYDARDAGELPLGGKGKLLAFGYPGDAVPFNQNELRGFCPVDADDLTAAEIEGRKAIRELVHWLRKNGPGFERCRVEQIAPQIGVRESRRIVGEFVLDWRHLRGLQRFEDTVACGAYPVDVHSPDGKRSSMSKAERGLEKGDWYDIPYRAFLPQDCENLLVAGRCLSATHEAAASVRVMPICTAMGEAVGIAAAQAGGAEGQVGDVDVQQVRSQLLDNGAFLG